MKHWVSMMVIGQTSDGGEPITAWKKFDFDDDDPEAAIATGMTVAQWLRDQAQDFEDGLND